MDLFIEISLIIVLATAIAALMRLLKQPLIIGYIITGLLLGPLAFGFVHSTETLKIFSEFGVSILLFIVGLHLSPKEAREVGKVAVLAGLGQIVFTSFFGFVIATMFGFGTSEAMFIAIAVTFSSTIIVLKLLSDKRDIEKLYGKIAIGILLVQDIAATIALVFTSTFANGDSSLSFLLILLLKGILLISVLVAISIKLLPKLGDFFAESSEFLFLFALGWGLGLASLFSYIGFSIEIGALIAGVTLSISPYSQEISSKLKPLRDFFIIMFFVFLGAEMNVSSIQSLLLPALVFSLFVLIAKPLIISTLLGSLNYSKRTMFFTSTSLAQISEFSLILILLALSTGQVSNEVLSLVTVIALITIAASTYLINYSEKLYPHMSKYMGFFEKKLPKQEYDLINAYDVVLFGCNRVGYDFLETFKHLGQKLLIVDFDPQTIKHLKNTGINCRYGDAEDNEFIEELNLGESKLVISTIPDFDTNKFLVKKLYGLNEKVITILISYNVDEALKLYELGGDYVILPHFIGGHFASTLAIKHWDNLENFDKVREAQIEYLNGRKKMGHEHPDEEF